jgi:hypothetical protein
MAVANHKVRNFLSAKPLVDADSIEELMGPKYI